MKTIIKISFKNLKQNYIEIQKFLEEKSCEKNIFIKSKIANDLDLWGDDNCDMLEDLITKYNLDFSEFNYSEYFESEGELFSPISTLLRILLIPFFFYKTYAILNIETII